MYTSVFYQQQDKCQLVFDIDVFHKCDICINKMNRCLADPKFGIFDKMINIER